GRATDQAGRHLGDGAITTGRDGQRAVLPHGSLRKLGGVVRPQGWPDVGLDPMTREHRLDVSRPEGVRPQSGLQPSPRIHDDDRLRIHHSQVSSSTFQVPGGRGFKFQVSGSLGTKNWVLLFMEPGTWNVEPETWCS